MNLQRIAIALVALVIGLMAGPGTGTAGAQPTDVVGTWTGRLAPDANTRLTIQFVISKKADGSYAAVLDSPDNPALRNVQATGVSFQGGALKLQVPSLSGSYAGTLKDGRIDGEWTQPGGKLPLVLAPFQPVQLSKAASSTLEGAWNGKLALAGGSVTVVTRFKPNDKGELVSTISVVEQGSVEIPISDIEFADNKLSFRVPRVNASYSGTLANGTITGTFKQPGPGMPPDGLPLALKRGDVAAQVHALTLASSAFAAVSGQWKGVLQGPRGPLNIVLRFETNTNGQYVAFLDSPDQAARGIPVTEASLEGNKLKVTVGQLGSLEGTMANGKTLTGTWMQGGQSLPITLTRS